MKVLLIRFDTSIEVHLDSFSGIETTTLYEMKMSCSLLIVSKEYRLTYFLDLLGQGGTSRKSRVEFGVSFLLESFL